MSEVNIAINYVNFGCWCSGMALHDGMHDGSKFKRFYNIYSPELEL